MRVVGFGRIVVMGVGLTLGLPGAPLKAAEEPFGQETVEIRKPRQPIRRASHAHAHSAGSHAGHRHGPASGHRHAHPAGRGHDHRHDHRHDHGAKHGTPDHAHAHGLETENLFGFTLGSDTEHRGARGIAIESVGRFGKWDGSYAGIGKKIEFAYGLTDDISVAAGMFAGYHRVRGVTGFDDTEALYFNGIGGELRWRLIRRTPGAFGVTLHLEPAIQTHDELTGLSGVKYGAENKLILDTELVKDRVYAAFNLLHELEHVRETGATTWESGSKIGIAVAATAKVTPELFLGGEARYLRAYDGLLPRTFLGEAFYVGPTLYARLAPTAWLSLAWNVQVAGREAGGTGRFDLTNFERHHLRLKAGIEF
jgi:hypothetical protein